MEKDNLNDKIKQYGKWIIIGCISVGIALMVAGSLKKFKKDRK